MASGVTRPPISRGGLAFSGLFGYLSFMRSRGISPAPLAHPATTKREWILSLLLFLSLVLTYFESASPAGRSDADLEASILRVKPAVVLISSEVGAEVTVRCGAGPVQTVRPDPLYETGSGFIIHPEGFIATNGHVVERLVGPATGATFFDAAARLPAHRQVWRANRVPRRARGARSFSHQSEGRLPDQG